MLPGLIRPLGLGFGGNDGYTKALMHFDGANASTAMVNSAAGSSSVFTSFFNASLDTTNAKFGQSSCFFDGTSRSVRGDSSSDFTFGTGDFTIDFWAWFQTVTTAMIMYDARSPSGTELCPVIYANTTTLSYYAGGVDRITSATVLATGQWYHVAVARASASTRLFLNGAQQGATYADTNNYVAPPAQRPIFGDSGSAPSTTVGMAGWLDEYRVSKGIARWTANFTPPNQAYY